MTQKQNLAPSCNSHSLPITEQVLDRLADILFATDDILGMLDEAATARDARTVAVARSVQGVYDEVNELMKRLSC